MRGVIHVLVLCAIAPGMLLPASAALCFCDALDCDACGTSCAIAAPDGGDDLDACCSERSECPHGPSVSERARCRGCVVLEAAKHETTKPRSDGDASPFFGAPLSQESCALPMLASASCTAMSRPTSHAPPGLSRSLPLLI